MSNTENKDHIRHQRLVQVVNKALEESMKTISDENLQSCYPLLSSTKQGKETISVVKEQLKESWFQNSQKEFDAIYKERDIEAKLNELDDLIIEAQDLQKNSEAKQIP
ncbi:Kinetochore-associated protein NNF1 [Wickerhamomyces ciferrii]|uniref:Kinetochore-associated protein NNF1 n=1 Tax=Wickerhamomyces ciferrii (strain ATCC 14091 / BCRC 22168 / CBS 111 / JCM 3599 / NBRC 0793 / NRRL Y-1031 F-60-10) TaxID=1206466 RepID=K0KMF5_WICCF|nr:Kinetochore-associated protein NNF1 [Wickerhamomyces ciferrii]CCH42268.1 Kinetochore-associated protein NNF1 [Wickerhamomyces ciferrii]